MKVDDHPRYNSVPNLTTAFGGELVARVNQAPETSMPPQCCIRQRPLAREQLKNASSQEMKSNTHRRMSAGRETRSVGAGKSPDAASSHARDPRSDRLTVRIERSQHLHGLGPVSSVALRIVSRRVRQKCRSRPRTDSAPGCRTPTSPCRPNDCGWHRIRAETKQCSCGKRSQNSAISP